MENVIVLRPKTIQLTGFVYNGLTDLANLIKFVGKTPQINADMSLNFKKQVVTENTVVFVNQFGDVINVIPVEKVQENFEVVKSLKFTPEHENKVIEKPVKTKKEKKAKENKK